MHLLTQKSWAFLAAVIYAVPVMLQSATWIAIHNFPTNSYSRGALIQAGDGALYGTTEQGGNHGYGSIFRVTTNGIYTSLLSFHYWDGAYPRAGLLQAHDGAFYGSTLNGSTNAYGSVFQLDKNGQLTTLAAFVFTNGAYPMGKLLQASDGSLYGTTWGGGDHGVGTVFRITTNGQLTTLVSFAVTNGARPYAGLTFGSDGALYGTTTQGGVNQDLSLNYGSVFRVTTNGDFTPLTLLDWNVGRFPFAGLTLADDGHLYGLCYGGAVFRITTNGVLTTISSPYLGDAGLDRSSDLLQYFDGAFYSVAAQGGSSGDGTLFRITTNGLASKLAEFRYSGGSQPYGKLLKANDGNLYGTTSQGGLYGGGSVFRAEVRSSIFMFPPVKQTNGWGLNFNGLSGDVYQVQRATNLLGPWTTLTNVAAGEFGDGHCADSDPPPGKGFYRLTFP